MSSRKGGRERIQREAMVKKMGEGRRKKGCREEERREVKSKKKGKKNMRGIL